MKKTSKVVLVGGLIALVVVLGLLVTMFGNVSIRALSEDSPQLVAAEPLLPGVPTTFTWSGVDTTIEIAGFYVRSAGKEVWVAEAAPAIGNVTTEIPCDILPGDHQLLMKNEATEEVLASAVVEVLPAGQDCAF